MFFQYLSSFLRGSGFWPSQAKTKNHVNEPFSMNMSPNLPRRSHARCRLCLWPIFCNGKDRNLHILAQKFESQIFAAATNVEDYNSRIARKLQKVEKVKTTPGGLWKDRITCPGLRERSSSHGVTPWCCIGCEVMLSFPSMRSLSFRLSSTQFPPIVCSVCPQALLGRRTLAEQVSSANAF